MRIRTYRYNGFVSLVAAPLLGVLILVGADGSESGAKDIERKPYTTDEETKVKKIEVRPTYSAEELEMLAVLIYQEAGGDACCDDCRRRVADVALNRVADERFPDTLEEVLIQERQYGRFHWTGIKWPDRAEKPEEAHAVERAYRIAKEVLEGQHSELYAQGYIWQAEFKQSPDTMECCGIYFGR